MLTAPDASTRKLLDVDRRQVNRFTPDGSGRASRVRENNAEIPRPT